MDKQKNGETSQKLEADIKKLTHIAFPSAPAVVLEQIATQGSVGDIRAGVRILKGYKNVQLCPHSTFLYPHVEKKVNHVR